MSIVNPYVCVVEFDGHRFEFNQLTTPPRRWNFAPEPIRLIEHETSTRNGNGASNE